MSSVILELLFATFGLYIAYSIKRPPLFKTKLVIVYVLVILGTLISIMHPIKYMEYHRTLIAIIMLLLTILYWREVKGLTTSIGYYRSGVVELLDEIPDLLWAKDKEGKYVYTNRATREKMLLSSENYVFGKTCKEISDNLTLMGKHSNFGDICTAGHEYVMSTGEPKQLLEIYEINNKVKVFQVYVSPILKDGEAIGTIGLSRDYTEEYYDHKRVLELMEGKMYDQAHELLKKLVHKFEFNF